MKQRIVIAIAMLALAVGTVFTIHKAKASGGPKPKPDLIVDQKRLLQNWVVRVENLPANFCSVQAASPPANASFCALPSLRRTSAQLM